MMVEMLAENTQLKSQVAEQAEEIRFLHTRLEDMSRMYYEGVKKRTKLEEELEKMTTLYVLQKCAPTLILTADKEENL